MQLLRNREACLAILIAIVTLIVTIVDRDFLLAGNLRDLLVRAAPTVIVCCGAMLLVLAGEIDISMGSSMGLLAALMGVCLSQQHQSLPLAAGIPIVLAAGAGIGATIGWLVAYGGVPSIVATLGMLTGLRGATMLIMQGENIGGLPPSLQQAVKVGYFGLPVSVWVAFAVVLVTTLIHLRTPWGRRLVAMGSSTYSARMVGLKSQRLKLWAFTYVGLMTAIATVVDVPRLPKIESGIGVGFELLVVTCIVVGGVSISGGRGGITGVLLAVLLMTMVRPVLTFMDVGETAEKWTRAIQGSFIMLAVIVDSVLGDSRKTNEPS